jgi:hypothetical protein
VNPLVISCLHSWEIPFANVIFGKGQWFELSSRDRNELPGQTANR